MALQNRYSASSFTAGQFTKIVRDKFSDSDLSFRTHRDYAVDHDMIIVAGSYDYINDDNDLPPIEIVLCYHPDQQLYTGATLDWEQISFDIAECIGHEMVHRDQHRSNARLAKYASCVTDVEKKAEQEYLGSDEELDAYGFSIAVDSHTFNKEYHTCAMYQTYANTFNNDHSVLVKLEEQIVKYLIQLTGVQL